MNRFNKASRSFSYFSLLFILLAFNKITAQTQSTPNGNFEIDQVVGCAPFTVTPRNIRAGNPILYYYENKANPEECSVDYRGGSGQDCFAGTNLLSDASFTYTNPGVYYLAQLNGSAADGDKISFIKITVIEAKEPTYNISVCTNNEVFVDLDFSDNEYEGYEIDFGDGSPSVRHFKGQSNPEQHLYLTNGDFDITVSGIVGGQTCSANTTKISTDIQDTSPEIQSIEVQDLNSVLIEYKELDRRLIHEMTIKGIDGSQLIRFGLDPVANPTQFLFEDAAYNFMNKPYSISITTTDFCNNFSETSLGAYTVVAHSSAAYTSTQIQLDFDYLTALDNLNSVELIENGSSVESFTTETGTAQLFINDCADLGEYYFQAVFGTAVSKSLLLSPDIDGTLTPPAVNITFGELTNLSFELDFEDAPVDVVEYTVFKKDLDGTFQRVGTRSDSRYIDSNLRAEQFELCYKVSYEDNCGNISELSAEMCFDVTFSNAQYPNAFSPNGDGVNDTFKATQGRFIEFSMVIFNRWGVIIFSSTDPEVGWDGTTNGQEASPGAYVYQVNYTDANKRSYQRTGTLVLIR
uniref:T9SS type B sorting domain-containing protein n=1 Tax=Roseivirga sp. TaxID=1964215 RepID=UPI004048AF09